MHFHSYKRMLIKILLGTFFLFPLFCQAQVAEQAVNKKEITYELSCVYAVGGESKLVIFIPKLNLIRKHIGNTLNYYYGVEGGIYPLFIAGSGSLGVLYGMELNGLNLETTLSHFRTTKINDGVNNYIGPFSQNLASLKIGFRYANFGIKAVSTFAVNESVPSGQERPPLLDIGRVNNLMLGVEAQIYFLEW